MDCKKPPLVFGMVLDGIKEAKRGKKVPVEMEKCCKIDVSKIRFDLASETPPASDLPNAAHAHKPLFDPATDSSSKQTL